MSVLLEELEKAETKTDILVVFLCMLLLVAIQIALIFFGGWIVKLFWNLVLVTSFSNIGAINFWGGLVFYILIKMMWVGIKDIARILKEKK